MLIDQQEQTEILQEYVQRFSDLLLTSNGLLPHQAEDLAWLTYFICNLHNQKLQHYVLGKSPTSVQNAITLAQKKDVELCIIEGLVHISGQTQMLKGTKSETEDIKDHHDSDSPNSNFDSSSDSESLSQTDKIIKLTISNIKHAANFPVTINWNRTISLFDTGATIS